jgi:hypothetical protein
MNLQQTSDICGRVCTVEGRAFSADMAEGWHELLKGVDWEVAQRASSLALQDYQIHQVQPKHILRKVPDAVAQLNALLKGDDSESGWRSEPCPICEAHGLPIVRCGDCTDVLVHQVGHLSGDRLHEWAKVHLYRADSLVGEEVPF